jgi:hypothetical protein
MFSADLMVDDTVKTANLLVERLGIPRWRPTWTDSKVDRLLYLRAYHPFSQAAPTLIEIIRPAPALPATSGQLPHRPVKTHATVFVTKAFSEVTANLDSKGLRYWQMPDPGDGLARLFTGVASFEAGTPGNTYDATVDGNIFMEVISWEGTALALREPIPPELSDGTITRVVARSYLVPDIDQTLHQLHEILAWEEASNIPSENSQVRFAALQPRLGTSAALELIQPRTETGRHGEFFARWGVGPHAIRLGVHGLDAKVQDLHRRGTSFTEQQTPAGERVLLVDESLLDGVIVELVEDPLYAGANGERPGTPA